MNHKNLVSVIVINYNGIKYCEDCFGSIRDLNYPTYEVIVIDNSSTDGSVNYIGDNFPEVKIIKLEKNVGFAKANNIAANSAKGEYLFFLNQDTVIEKNTLNELVERIESDPQIGICGCKMLFWHEKSVLNSTGLVVNKICFVWDRGSFELDQKQYDDETQVISVSGGAMLIRKDLFIKLGGFDVKYFMYYEDLDLGIRTWLSGHRVVYVPRAKIYHKMQYNHANQHHFQYIDHRNRIRTILKSFSLRNLLSMLLRSAIYDFKTIIHWLLLWELELIKYRFLSILWNLKLLTNTINERSKIQKNRIESDDTILEMMTPGYETPTLPAAVPRYIVKSTDTLNLDSTKSHLNIGVGDDEQLGFGWYDREIWNGKNIRWTTNYASAFLKRIKQYDDNTPQIIEIEMYSPLEINGKLYLNEKYVGKFKFNRPGWQNFDFKLIDEREIQKVTIKTPGFIPSNIYPNSKDSRTLGVAVAWINVKSQS